MKGGRRWKVSCAGPGWEDQPLTRSILVSPLPGPLLMFAVSVLNMYDIPYVVRCVDTSLPLYICTHMYVCMHVCIYVYVIVNFTLCCTALLYVAF